MSYKLLFLPRALKEWEKLDNNVKLQFKKKLKEREVIVLVVGVREKDKIYKLLEQRKDKE